MKTLRQKQAIAKKLAMLWLEKGKVLTETEYLNTNPVPYPRTFLRSIFGSFPRAVNYSRFVCPEAFEELAAKADKPKEAKVEAPKKVEKKEAKATSLEDLAKGVPNEK